jgi:adenine-specific DNA-methyltransferase
MKESKLNGETKDIKQEEINALRDLMPDIFKDGKIDFDWFKNYFKDEIEESNERYNFTWNGKLKALHESQKPSTGTLRPCKEESKNWDNTDNLYIEGDNLEVLKLLQKTYHNKIKMIYIDPPYNTGKDFVYKDNYKDNLKNYLELTNQIDEEGNRISTNQESNGRYHTDWLNMMYPRLRLARNLLTDDGVIFISIDDHEVHNLRKICDEVFGESNFIDTIIWQRAYAPVNMNKYFSHNHDYSLVYAKEIEMITNFGLKRSEKSDSRYKNPDNDPRGVWQSDNFSVGPRIEKKVYEIINPNGKKIWPPSGRCWRVTREKYFKLLKDNRIWFGQNNNGVPRLKRFLSEVQSKQVPLTIWTYDKVGHSQDAKKNLNKLFNNKSYFEYPKSLKLIKMMIELNTQKNDIILDFFSGSGTTAHATMQLNAEDGGNRKYIMVQLPESTKEDSEAYKDGYKNLCEIGKERIRRAGEKIKEENKNTENLDTGFKVFKLDSSNIKPWNPDFKDIEKDIKMFEDNIVEGRNGLDIVYEIMIKYGINLTYKVEEHEVLGKKIYSIGMGMLLICLEKNITKEIADKIIKLKKELKPETMKVVFRDNGFKSDSDKINIKETLRNANIDEFVCI